MLKRSPTWRNCWKTFAATTKRTCNDCVSSSVGCSARAMSRGWQCRRRTSGAPCDDSEIDPKRIGVEARSDIGDDGSVEDLADLADGVCGAPAPVLAELQVGHGHS